MKVYLGKYNTGCFVLWVIMLVAVVSRGNEFDGYLYPVIISFLLFNILISLLPKEIIVSAPVIIIQITGFIRYMVMAYIIKRDSITIPSTYISTIQFIWILEIVGTLFGLLLYSYKRHFIKARIKYDPEPLEEYDQEPLNTKIGIVALILLIVGSAIVFSNQSLISRYFSLSGSSLVSSNRITGFAGLIVSAFFLLVYVLSIQFVYNIRIFGNFTKVILSLLLSIFFVNGTSITDGNVSRWTMLISAFIAFMYISKLYPSYKKGLVVILIGAGIFAVTIGTMMKFGDSYNAGYGSISETLETSLSFKSLNAYFSGPRNMDIGLSLIKSLPSGLSYNLTRLVSDLFANFPLLNHYLSSESIQTTGQFNLMIYGSTIAKDQIVPYSIQLYSYLGPFFIIVHAVFVYWSMRLYSKLLIETDYLGIYCLVYASIWPALYNCISVSVILQNMWIHVIPILIVYTLNKSRRHKNLVNRGAIHDHIL